MRLTPTQSGSLTTSFDKLFVFAFIARRVKCHVRTLGHQFQILYAVVVFIFVKMMHHLSSGQVTTYLLLHHQAMFKNIAVHVRRWMIWSVDVNIAGFVLPASAFPFRMLRTFGLDAVVMAVKKSLWITAKKAIRARSNFCNICFLSASTLTKPARNFFGLRLVALMLGLVAFPKSRRAVFMIWMRNYWKTASAGA